MARFIWKDSVGVTLDAEDGEEISTEQAAAQALVVIADMLDRIQYRLESMEDTYNAHKNLDRASDSKT